MRSTVAHISLLLVLALSLFSCGKTPDGVLNMNEMSDLLYDLQLANAYIDLHSAEFPNDSTKQVVKQSVFKKHGITQQEYDSTMVWYAHNMEDYSKAYDKALGRLKEHYDKLSKGGDKNIGEAMAEIDDIKNGAQPPRDGAGPSRGAPKHLRKLSGDTKADSVDLWQGKRSYWLAQGNGRGFITFDFPVDPNSKRGDRYQLSYRLARCNNEFKVSLSVDYTDGATSQITRSTNSDGWVTVDVQSDTARQVRRVYGYVSYNIKPKHAASIDSLTLMRTRMNVRNYGFVNAQRLFERNKK